MDHSHFVSGILLKKDMDKTTVLCYNTSILTLSGQAA